MSNDTLPQPFWREPRNWPWLTLAAGALVMIVYQSPQLTSWLSFDRPAVGAWQLWRIVTGHITHWSRSHMTWDLFVFLVISVIAERVSRVRLVVAWLASALAISAWVWFAEPTLSSYRGLSGIDSALFVMVSITAWQRAGPADGLQRWLPAAALGCFVAKLIFEVAAQSTLFVNDSAMFVPVPAAHAVGGLVGLLIAIWGVRFLKPQMNTDEHG